MVRGACRPSAVLASGCLGNLSALRRRRGAGPGFPAHGVFNPGICGRLLTALPARLKLPQHETKGTLPSAVARTRHLEAQRNALPNPATGVRVINTSPVIF